MDILRLKARVKSFNGNTTTIKQEFEMKRVYIILFFFFTIGLAPDCSAEATKPPGKTSIQSSSADSASDSGIAASPAGPEKDFRLEISGNYNWLDNDYGQWKVLDLRLRYSGLKKLTPFGSVSTQSRKEGSQRNYALGSYIHVNPGFYMISGISVAPVKDPDVVIYPRLRMDLSGYLSVPAVDGLVLSTGISHFPKQNGNGGDIISIGGLYYYGRFIFNGLLNYNIARPGNVTSLSVQAGIMFGEEGRYWTGGGFTVGRVAYQLASETPFDVRYRSRGANMFYRTWIGEDWGINTQLDYQNLAGAYRLKGITLALFVDF